MPRLLPALAALTLLAASGCELLVDPQSKSSGGPETTNAGTGSGATSTSSGATTSGTGTSSETGTSSTGTGATSGTGVSATGASGGSVGSTTATTTGTIGTGTTTSAGTSSTSTSTTGTPSTSSSTTTGSGTSTSTSTTTGGGTTTTTTTTTGGGTTTTTTTTTGGGTTGMTCAGPYGTTGGQPRSCIQPLLLTGTTLGDAGIAGGSTGSSGSTGGIGADAGGPAGGSTGSSGGTFPPDAGGPIFPDAGTPSPDAGYAPSCEFACWRVPDSLASCVSTSACAAGTDDAYTYPVSSVCPSETLTDPSNSPVQYAQDVLTGIEWEQSPMTGLDWTTAAQSYCGGYWTDAFQNGAPVHQPTMAELLGLIDFGSAGHVPAQLGGGSGQVWSSDESTVGSDAFYLNFDTGEFGHQSEGSSLQARCTVGPPSFMSPYDFCDTSTPNSGCTLMGPNGPLTGLYFLFPGKVTTWSNALTYCQDQVGDFCGEYRLPSYKELATLVNFTQGPTGTFIDSVNGEYWSSTPAPKGAGWAMAISFANVVQVNMTVPDSAGFAESTGTSAAVACVRGP